MNASTVYIQENRQWHSLSDSFQAVNLEDHKYWDSTNLKDFQKLQGIEIDFNNTGDLIYEHGENGKFYYAKVPKNKTYEGAKELVNEVEASVFFRNLGINCPEEYFPVFDSSNNLRISSVIDRNYYRNPVSDNFSDWSEEGKKQLKLEWTARQYYLDSDANHNRVCYNPENGEPLFVDFASIGGQNIKSDIYGHEFVSGHNDPDVMECIAKIKSVPLEIVVEPTLRKVVEVLDIWPLVKDKKEWLNELIKERIEFHIKRRGLIEKDIRSIFS
jgi:hypothetical protein